MSADSITPIATAEETSVHLAKYRGGPMTLEKADGTVVFECTDWSDMLDHLRSINHPSLFNKK